MAWPNSTKASTLNVDNGADKPSLARADIKQNIDNVNSIIDTFDIASPTNGDILIYNSTSGAWEPGANGGGGGGSISNIWGTTNSNTQFSGFNLWQLSSNTFNNGNISNISTGTDSWRFSETGSYRFRVNILGETGSAGFTWVIYNNTQSTSTLWDNITNVTNPSTTLKYNWNTLTVTSTSDTYSFGVNSTGSSTTISSSSEGWNIEIIKS